MGETLAAGVRRLPRATPPGPALGLPAYRVRDQAFADPEGTQSVALAPTADPPWTW